MTDLELELNEIIDSAAVFLSDVQPSAWCEQNRVMTTEETPFAGPFSYDRTPYCREIVDCISPNHPAKIIAVKKGAQIGFSTGVIEPGIGYVISQSPGNILFLTGHSDLSEEAIAKIDKMIDNCGLRKLIRPNVLRKKNMRTGDTNKSKEFPGGKLVAGSATNHKLLMQRSVRYGFIDDFDAAKQSSVSDGSTKTLIEQRFAAYYSKMKLFYISTPRLKQTSNIEPVFLMGDQRRYMVPCPCCGDFIQLHWTVDITGTEGKEKGGITWKTDEQGKLMEDSVGYVCQSCSGFFTDQNKKDMLMNGFWKPTATPVQPHYYSYHVSSLYAPPGMYDWVHYVHQYLEANPINEPQKDDLQKTFVNLCLGEPYEQKGETPRANDLQKNIRQYEVGTVPEKLSMNDGNGSIILLTCACDLNGIVEDARLDYEIVGWSESGASYSITHGSIGTFVPREGAKKFKEDRERWTYEHGKNNSVWPELEKVLDAVYTTDTARSMKIFIAGVDTGHYTQMAYNFIDKQHRTNMLVYGLKGKDADKYVRFGVDVPSFSAAKERGKLFMVQVNMLKDTLADLMKLKWDKGNDEIQPSGFMNYPTPSAGKYLFQNFFSHYEAEERVIESVEGQGVAACWRKVNTNVQNHFWDVRIYNMVLRDILVAAVTKELKIPKGTWKDYVDVVMSRTK